MLCENCAHDAPVPAEVKQLVQERLAHLVEINKLRAEHAFNINRTMLLSPSHMKAIEYVGTHLVVLPLGDRLFLESALIGGPEEAWSYREAQNIARQHHRLY